MPAVDTPYIIGVIREREKTMLGQDEMTRIREAASGDEALGVLADTAFGPYLEANEGLHGAKSGLVRRLVEIKLWLADVVPDERVLAFISARYDALNAAAAMLQHHRGLDEPHGLSPLGQIDHSVLHSVLWQDLGWEEVPEVWEGLLRDYRALKPEPLALASGAADQLRVWRELAFTPLMREIVAWHADKTSADAEERPLMGDADGIAYDRMWDEKLLALIRHYRLDAQGYDPILAYWYAHELEVTAVRLLLSGKFMGLPREQLRLLERPLYGSLA